MQVQTSLRHCFAVVMVCMSAVSLMSSRAVASGHAAKTDLFCTTANGQPVVAEFKQDAQDAAKSYLRILDLQLILPIPTAQIASIYRGDLNEMDERSFDWAGGATSVAFFDAGEGDYGSPQMKIMIMMINSPNAADIAAAETEPKEAKETQAQAQAQAKEKFAVSSYMLSCTPNAGARLGI